MKRLRDETGTIMITAIIAVTLMTALGLAAMAQVDTQTSQSRVERERESAFNLAEAALSAQTFVLGRLGTGTQLLPYPASCSTASSSDRYCPSSAQLMRSYGGNPANADDNAGQVDFDTGTQWQTWVRDDATPAGAPVNFWQDVDLANTSWARYDKAGGVGGIPNKHVWVRAQATVRGRTRALVAYVRIEDKPINFPAYSVLAGFVKGQNNGNKTLVTSTGSPLGLGVRCSSPPQSANCIDLSPTKGPQLVPPGAFELNIPGNSSAVPPDNPAIDSDALQALEDVARANGTYYATGCPANPNGKIVVVENGTGCLYNNSAPAAAGQTRCCNSQASPGVFILKKGTVNFGGNIEFWGIVYNANLDNSTGSKLIETSGTSVIRGSALVDGRGGVWAGSSGENIVYNASAFAGINAVGTAGVVQNTWREIVPIGN
jgi:hypothetical protein